MVIPMLVWIGTDLQGDAFARGSCEGGEALYGPARDQGLIAPVELAHGFLYEGHPQLLPLCLRESARLTFGDIARWRGVGGWGGGENKQELELNLTPILQA